MNRGNRKGQKVVFASLLILVSCAPGRTWGQPRTIESRSANITQDWQIGLDAGSFPGPLDLSGNFAFLSSNSGLGGRLSAYNVDNGDVAWNVPLPLKQSGILAMTLTGGMIVTTTPYGVNAYSSDSGGLAWEAVLGQGHVRTVAQVEDGIVRVYYGETLHELAIDTGIPEMSSPLGELLWRTPDVDIVRRGRDDVAGLQRSTGNLLWERDHYPFILLPDRPPQTIDDDHVLVPFELDVCSLQLTTGEDDWCVNGPFSSNVTMDPGRKHVFFLTDQLHLTRVVASSGAIDGEVVFSPAQLPGTGEHEEYLHFIAATDSKILIAFADSGYVLCLDEE